MTDVATSETAPAWVRLVWWITGRFVDLPPLHKLPGTGPIRPRAVAAVVVVVHEKLRGRGVELGEPGLTREELTQRVMAQIERDERGR